MNDEVKEILIDLVEYYNAIGSEDDPGIGVFENVVQRASKVLQACATNAGENKQDNTKSVDIDPFSFDVIGGYGGYAGQEYGGFPEAPMKMEDEL